MDFKARIFAIAVINIVLLHDCQACDSGWFGSGCQFKCHCDGDAECDDATGECQGGGCDPVWFGPACQYESASYSTNGAEWLFQDTCNDASDQTVSVTLQTPRPITWIRLILNPAGVDTDDIDVSYQNYLGDNVASLDSQRVKVNDEILDISQPTYESVATVTLSGAGVGSLCSLYISGGRNVALLAPGYTVDQINIYYSNDGWGPENAVDGEAPPGSEPYEVRSDGCSQTQSTPNPWWELSFGTQSFYVNKFVIYGRRDPTFNDRLGEFLLRAYSEGVEVYSYQDANIDGLDIYTLVPEPRIEAPVDAVVIDTDKTTYFELCEVEIYGDSACQEGFFGRDCENQCRCADDVTCLVSTGGCPSGCDLGYTGEDCQKACPVGSYGQECKETCSSFCTPANSCNNVDGSCECQTGFEPPTCEDVCPAGRYGQDCADFCSKNCIGEDNSCNYVDGSCDQGCETGYQSATCTDAIDPSETAGSGSGGIGQGAEAAVIVLCLVAGIIVCGIVGAYLWRRRGNVFTSYKSWQGSDVATLESIPSR